MSPCSPNFVCTAQSVPLSCHVCTPQQALRRAREQGVEYGFAQSPLGELLFVWVGQQLCRLEFAFPHKIPIMRTQLSKQWLHCNLSEARHKAIQLTQNIFYADKSTSIELLLHGTVFQVAVWRSLLAIPSGQTISYAGLATLAGYTQASRAVGTAMAQNPIVYIVPCHRVVRSNGQIGNYGGGLALKQRLLTLEHQGHSIAHLHTLP